MRHGRMSILGALAGLVALACMFAGSEAQAPPEAIASPLETMREWSETLRHEVYEIEVGLVAEADCERITHSFIRGADAAGTVQVTVRCANSGDWIIFEPTSGGSTVLPCDHAETIMRGVGFAAPNCWTPIGGS